MIVNYYKYVYDTLYEKMIDIIDDYSLSKVVDERLHDGSKPIKVDIDDLLS